MRMSRFLLVGSVFLAACGLWTVLCAARSAAAWVRNSDGQDLVEYALLVALIAFGAVASLQGLSSQVNLAFTTISMDFAQAL